MSNPNLENELEKAVDNLEETAESVIDSAEPELAKTEETEETVDAASETSEETETEGTESEVPAAEAGESEEVPEAPRKKKSKAPVIIISVIAALVLAIAAAVGIVAYRMSKDPAFATEIENMTYPADKTALIIKDENGNVVDELTNAELNFHFWGSFYSYINANGISFDLGQKLEDQIYGETQPDSAGEVTQTTWYDYFMDNARLAAIQARGLYLEAQAAGFEMPADRQAEYDSLLENLTANAQQDGFVDENGNGDILTYIQDSYGEAVTVDMFMDYIYERYYVEAYSESLYNAMTFTDQELNDYFDQNADTFIMYYGMEKSDAPDVSVRHILIQPEAVEADEEGNQDEAAVEAAKAAAKEEAERILAEWQDGDATEEYFAELAGTYSTDPGSASNGGLYDDVYPGQMVPSFNDWCFDESRQPGDTGIVETDYGYHIMYFVGKLDVYAWKQAVDSDMRYTRHMDYLNNLMAKFTGEYQEKAAVQEPPAVRETREQTAAEAAAAATASVASANETVG